VALIATATGLRTLPEVANAAAATAARNAEYTPQ